MTKAEVSPQGVGGSGSAARDVSTSQMQQDTESGFEKILLIQAQQVTPPAPQNDGLKTLGTFQGKYHLFRNCQTLIPEVVNLRKYQTLILKIYCYSWFSNANG